MNLGGESMTRLGRITVDGYSANVDFQDHIGEEYLYHLTLTFRKPRAAPAVATDRIEVWLLGSDTVPRDQPHTIRPAGPFLPEVADGATVTVRAVYFFANPLHYNDLTVVVAVDGRPKAFRVPKPTAGVAPGVIDAWKKAGATFASRDFSGYADTPPLPGFYTKAMTLPPAEKLPLPKVPFALVWDNEKGMPLARLPGLDRATWLLVNRSGPLTGADLKTLAGLKQLQYLAVTGFLEEKEVKGLARLNQVRVLRVSSRGATDEKILPLAWLTPLRDLDVGNSYNVTDVGVLALAPLRELRKLDLYYVTLTDAGMKALAGFQELRTLSLSWTKITDAGLKELAGLRQLTTLDLSSTAITDAGLEHLAGLAHLETLNLSGTGVTGAGLAHLAGLKRLRSVNLSGAKLNDAGMKGLGRLTRLRTLDLTSAAITGAGLRELAGLQHLQTLHLGHSTIPDADFRELAHLKGLRELSLNDTQIGDAGLKGLAGLKDLRTLHLSCAPFTAAGLKALAGLHNLEDLTLWDTNFGDAGLKHLAGLKRLRLLTVYQCGITDAGLKHLTGLQQLEKLDLSGHSTEVLTYSGLAELRKAIPWTYVYPHRMHNDY
jgi:Leucine-rich repeat (LRR) protein